jgi:hypothetical protein
MDTTTLEKANELNVKISEFSAVLNCFEYESFGETISLNPRLIIEFDGDGRDQLKIPMNLSKQLTDLLKAEIIKGRDAAVAEFNAL